MHGLTLLHCFRVNSRDAELTIEHSIGQMAPEVQRKCPHLKLQNPKKVQRKVAELTHMPYMQHNAHPVITALCLLHDMKSTQSAYDGDD